MLQSEKESEKESFSQFLVARNWISSRSPNSMKSLHDEFDEFRKSRGESQLSSHIMTKLAQSVFGKCERKVFSKSLGYAVKGVYAVKV